jgi:hypothetical protein
MSQGSVRGGWPVLRPGDWVHYDGGEHQVVTLTGTAVRLRAAAGGQSVVLAAHLMSAPGFSGIEVQIRVASCYHDLAAWRRGMSYVPALRGEASRSLMPGCRR